jgi:4,5-dihydroxyphthalate decarboxylase
MEGPLRFGVLNEYASYYRWFPLLNGVVQPKGVHLSVQVCESVRQNTRQLLAGDLDAGECSLSSFLRARAQGRGLLGLPIFRLGFVAGHGMWCRRDSELGKPADLAGKRVGVESYSSTAMVWGRAVLQHRFGVHPRQLRWVVCGEELLAAPGLDVEIEHVGGGRGQVVSLLERGGIDAALALNDDDYYRCEAMGMRPLFNTTLAYRELAGVYPVLHLVVIQEAVVRRQPQVALELVRVTREAAELAGQAIGDSLAAYLAGRAWTSAEEKEREARRAVDRMNHVFYTYQLGQAEREALERFMGHQREQGLLNRELSVAELFCPSTL